MSVLLRQLRSSPSFHHLTTPFASTIYRFLSAATTPVPPPLNPHFTPVDYLIQSCELTQHEAIRTCQKMQRLKQPLKSPDKPDAVLQFLRQTGVTESDIRTAVAQEPRILCSSVEKNLRPNLARLREIGLSIEDISGIISRFPHVWVFNFVAKVDFWMQALGSAEIVSGMLKKGASILSSNLEKVVVPNLSFLQEECCMSHHQIVRLITSNPRLFTLSLETLKLNAKRAEQLGIERSSGMFVNAFITVSKFSQHIIIARLLYLKSFGLSQEEVALMIGKSPSLLTMQEVPLGRKMKFLMKEAGCGKIDVVQNPVLLGLSLEKRLIPRNLVQKLLKSKNLPVANQAFVSSAKPNEQLFVEKFVLPYEHVFPGLLEAYTAVCAGEISGTEWFRNCI
ncbi:transcription termination factor MTERF8, chloroplastic-like [Carex rostrata]